MITKITTVQEAVAQAVAELRNARERIARLLSGEQAPSFDAQVESLVNAFRQIEGKCQFVGFTYTSKSTGEVARYTLQIGASYKGLVEKSILEMDTRETEFRAGPLGNEAFEAVRASLVESLAAMAEGREHVGFTKAGMYAQICPGLKMSLRDGSLEICGVQHSRVVITPGIYKTVNSRPLTIAKDKIRGELPIAKYRTLAIDPGTIHGARINGETLEFD